MKSAPGLIAKYLLLLISSMIFGALVFSQPQSNQNKEAVLRIDTHLAVFDVLVLDEKQRSVSGLTMDDFIVKEDGKEQTLTGFALGDGSAISRSIVLIIDHSGSQQPYLKTSIAAAKTLLDKLKPNDRMALVTDDVSVLVGFTSNKQTLKNALEGLLEPTRKSGKSQQYSALLAVFNQLIKNEIRPVLIFQTDGDELGLLKDQMPKEMYRKLSATYKKQLRDFSLSDIYTVAVNSRATIYSVIPGLRFIDIPESEQIVRAKIDHEKIMGANSNSPLGQLSKMGDVFFAGRARANLESQLALANLAKLTGGWVDYLEEPEQAEAVYNRIFSGIENRYILSYSPTNEAKDGKQRRVEIKIRNHNKYTIWGKNSYYASKE